MKYVIDRRKWLRGDQFNSYLRRKEDGKMCCLGQISRQCGIAARDLTDMVYPSELNAKSKLPAWLFNRKGENSRWATAAMRINDAIGVNPDTREKRLQEIFARHGDELEFIN